MTAGQGRYRIVGWHNPATGTRHVYQFVEAPFGIRWRTARDIAATLRFGDRAGHLVTVTSLQEHSVIVEHLLNQIDDLRSTVLIGLSDAATEGEFTWVTGEPLSFSCWIDGEPNDTSNNEDIVEYRRIDNTTAETGKPDLATAIKSWGWNDAHSVVGDPRGFIVEYDLDD